MKKIVFTKEEAINQELFKTQGAVIQYCSLIEILADENRALKTMNKEQLIYHTKEVLREFIFTFGIDSECFEGDVVQSTYNVNQKVINTLTKDMIDGEEREIVRDIIQNNNIKFNSQEEVLLQSLIGDKDALKCLEAIKEINDTVDFLINSNKNPIDMIISTINGLENKMLEVDSLWELTDDIENDVYGVQVEEPLSKLIELTKLLTIIIKYAANIGSRL